MQSAVKITTVVQSGGRVEVTAPELMSGERVEVIILSFETAHPKRRSVLDILADAPGHRLFKSAEEVDVYIREERGSWEH